MRLGNAIYGSIPQTIIINAAKYLDLLPVGAVIRNQCDSGEPEGWGTHMKKTAKDFDDRWSWQHCAGYAPYNTATSVPNAGISKFRPTDIYLPVQVVFNPDEERVARREKVRDILFARFTGYVVGDSSIRDVILDQIEAVYNDDD